jgi:CRISPR-associated protein Csx10
VIRGAIASQILQQSGQQFANLAEDGGDFQALFLGDNAAVFQNAYSAVAIGDKSEVVSDAVMVLPATAVSSKTEPGFLPKGNGVFDTLIDRFCATACNFAYDPNCPTDFGRVEPFRGFYSKNSHNKYRSHTVSKRFLTRVGINRHRATAEEDILYSIQVLNESFLEDPKDKQKNWHDYRYRSYILVEDEELAQKFLNFLNHNSSIFRLGSATSRGLGKVKFQAIMDDSQTDVETKIHEFNSNFQKHLNLYKSIFGNQQEENILSARTYFTLDLQSDAILTENWRRTTVISETMLEEFTNVTDSSLKMEVAYSSYDYLSGWNSAWGLMKDLELVTNSGSVYLFSTEQPQLWLDKLKEIEYWGVGERTAEGFGQVQICNEFHTRFRHAIIQENAK